MNLIDFGGTAHLIYECGYLGKFKISEGCGGSLANTLYWLNLFGNKVLVRGLIGNDIYGQILNKTYLYSPKKNIIVDNFSSAYLSYFLDQSGNILNTNFNYGVAVKIEKLIDFPINCRTNIIGGFELENAKTKEQKNKLCFGKGETLVLNLGGLKDQEKLKWIFYVAKNYQNLIIIGNKSEVDNLLNNKITHNNYLLIITKSDKGAELFYKKKNICVKIPKNAKKIIDTIGAGDGVLAMFLDQWYEKKQTFTLKDLESILIKAVDFGTLISTYYGARPKELSSNLVLR